LTEAAYGCLKPLPAERFRRAIPSSFVQHDALRLPDTTTTGPSTLLRIGPSQCSASVLSPRGYLPLELLPWHRNDWFLQFRAKACIRFTPPIRRSPPARSPGSWQADPRNRGRPWFWRRFSLTTSRRRVHFRSSLGCSPARVYSRAFVPTLTTTPLKRSRLEWFETCS
jgi:hypothetical protein